MDSISSFHFSGYKISHSVYLFIYPFMVYVKINIQIIPKMDAVFSFETLIPKYRTVHRTRVLWKVLELTIKNEFIISKLLLFFNIISLKTNTLIPAMFQRHLSVPVVVLRKICKIPLQSCSRLSIRRKTLTSEEEF